MGRNPQAEIVEMTFVFPTLWRILVVFIFLVVSPQSFLFGLIYDKYPDFFP